MRSWSFLVALAACAGGAPRLREGERCRVTLHDRRTGTSFHLVNEAYAPRQAFYSRRREDAATKILKGESMQYLLDRLEASGFGRFAAGGDRAAAESGVVSYVLTVERDGTARSVARRASDSAGQAESIGAMVESFREVYDGVFAAQTILNPQGPDYFERVKRRLEPTSRTGAEPQGS